MFKLKKILGARNNNPEIVEIDVVVAADCIPGRLYIFNGDNLCLHNGTKSNVVFIPIEYAPGDYTQRRIRGYYVSSNMIFETKVHGETSGCYCGNTYKAHINDMDMPESVDGIEISYGDFCIVTDPNECFYTGTVYIRILVD